MKKILYLLLAIMIPFFATAQNSTNFRSPLDIPLYLSGNFGELRSDHFHSGIDIKTQGITGQKVYSVEDGYVSRIKVQAGGYGHALYIAHPNGYTSVYGHLSSYNRTITGYLRNVQYKRESFEVDIYLKPGELPVKKGDIVALSGNSGSSAGPHLHFEIRKSANQHPENVLLYDFPVQDDIPPRFSQLIIYPRGKDAQVNFEYNPLVLSMEGADDKYRPARKNPFMVFGEIGFGVEVYDYLNGSNNRCGIYSLELQVDGETRFMTEIGGFSFAESRFINAHIDYSHKAEQQRTVQRLYRLPYNQLSIYKQALENGTINIRDTLIHKVDIKAVDAYGNQSALSFYIKGTGAAQQMASRKDQFDQLLPHNVDGGYSNRDISLSYPAYAFYEDIPFNFERSEALPGTLSDVFHVHSASTPVHKAIKLSLNADLDLPGFEEKICMVSIGEEGEISCVGGEFKDGMVTATIRNFGKFAIAIDTIAPVILPVNIEQGRWISNESTIRFTVTDKLSGISSYRGLIDDQWVLMEYDSKNDLLYYTFDEERFKSNGKHELELYVEDGKGNRSVYATTFYRK